MLAAEHQITFYNLISIDFIPNHLGREATLLHQLAFPYSTSVIFGSCNSDVPLIVEGTGKDFITVPSQNLQAFTTFHVPDSCRLVTAGRHDLVPIGVYGYFRYLVLMSNESNFTCSRRNIEQP